MISFQTVKMTKRRANSPEKMASPAKKSIKSSEEKHRTATGKSSANSSTETGSMKRRATSPAVKCVSLAKSAKVEEVLRDWPGTTDNNAGNGTSSVCQGATAIDNVS